MKTMALAITCLLLTTVTFAQDNLNDYKNYDFVPGNKIIFQDDMLADKAGQQPLNWNVSGGHVTIGNTDNENYIAILEYYTILSPKLKTPNYLPDNYTIEFDCWLDAGYDGNPGVQLSFLSGDEVALLTPNTNQMNLRFPGGELNGDTPPEIAGEKFYNKWNHVAFSYDKKQVKFYFNQFLIASIPDCNFKATSIAVHGNSSQQMNMFFKHFKIATGSSPVADAFNTGKFTTQAIKFDVNKATLKPESMGVINEVYNYLKSNTAIKVEIGGHTDSDGDDASNLTLSQQRADVVKNQLVKMGIDAARITAKGYGETKPLNKNSNSDEKALNRRVEFIKL